MQNNFDDLFDSINVEEAAKLLDCIGDIQMNEKDRINMRNNVLKKAEKYGIKPEPIDDIEKRGMYMNNNNKDNTTGSIIDFNNNESPSHSGFTKFLKIACVFAVVLGVGALISINVMKNKQGNTTATGNPESTEPIATDNLETPTPTDNFSSKAPSTSNANSSEQNSKIKISSELKHVENDLGDVYLIVNATSDNGEKIWSYKTEATGLTELDTIEQFGECNDLVYINFCGFKQLNTTNKIIALDKKTGKVVWTNNSFEGASVAFDFDENGTLYICGYYLDLLVAIDKNGKTLWSTTVDEKYGYGNLLKVENDVITLTTGLDEDFYVRFNTKDGNLIR